MHYIKKIYVLLLTGSIVSITGCSAIQYGTEDLPKPTYQKSTEDTAKDIVKSKAEEEHQEFELSDEFVSKYLDTGRNCSYFQRSRYDEAGNLIMERSDQEKACHAVYD